MSSHHDDNDDRLWTRGAAELAALIKQRVVSSSEVIDSHLARIDEVNPAVNAITTVLAESARVQAKRIDAAIAAGKPVGPLAGVPFTIKDNVDVAGEATTNGVTAFRDLRASQDAPAVAHLRAAGAIPLARTNMPDFGLRWHTESGLHGATVNPWNPGLSPYGSSGGEAVALATGMSPLGVGNDYGGSIRLPSAAAGTVGLRPTHGRIASVSSTNPLPPTPTVQLFAVEGPMARRVEDVSLAYRLMCQPDIRDPQWVPVPPELPIPGEITVAMTTDPGGCGTHPDIVAAVRRAGDIMREAGVTVVELDPPDVIPAATLWRTLSTADLQGLLNGPMRQLGTRTGLTYLEQSVAHVEHLSRDDYIQALARRHSIAAAWSQFHATYHAVLGPVSTDLPYPVGFDNGGPDNADAMWLAHRLLVAVNMLGLPALAVPVGTSPGGLPQSVQLIGGRYQEALCMRLAAHIEAGVSQLTPINPRTATLTIA